MENTLCDDCLFAELHVPGFLLNEGYYSCTLGHEPSSSCEAYEPDSLYDDLDFLNAS